MKTVAIGIIGFGTVAKGVVEVLEKNAREIERRCGYRLQVKAVARRSWEGVDTQMLSFVCSDNPYSLIEDEEIEIILELAGGVDLAGQYIEAALLRGKHVVTANKALIATRGQALFDLAREQGLELAYEAAVAGGIPIIKVLREGMSGNQVLQVAGIINGTSNFILTAMTEQGRDFAEVLTEAQALGYAEADPTFDIDGTDAAHKITILASIAFGIELQFEGVYKEGIDHINAEDLQYADELGFRIKHLGLAIRRENGVEIRVHPTLIPKNALLSSVSGVMNAVQVNGNALGEGLYYGAGAGALPTASAVIADLIDVVRELNLSQEDRLAEFGFHQLHDKTALPVLPSDEYHSSYYLNLRVADKVGVLAEVTKIFAKSEISIASIIQKNALAHENVVTLIILTNLVKESSMNAALEQLQTLEALRGQIKRIRVEFLG